MRKHITMAMAADVCSRLIKGQSRTAVWRATGVSTQACNKAISVLRDNGFAISRPGRPPFNQEREDHLHSLFRTTDLSNRAICREHGYYLSCVNHSRLRYTASLKARGEPVPMCECGLELHHPRVCVARVEESFKKRGIKNRMTLGAQHLQELKERVMSGEPYKSIAASFDLSKSSVTDFVRDLGTEDREALRRLKSLPQAHRRARQLAKAVSRPKATTARVDPLYEHMRRALPVGIDPTLRDDALSEAYTQILEGRIAIASAAEGVRAIYRKLVRSHASKWGDFSLDMPIAPGSSVSFADGVEDPRALEAFDRI